MWIWTILDRLFYPFINFLSILSKIRKFYIDFLQPKKFNRISEDDGYSIVKSSDDEVTSASILTPLPVSPNEEIFIRLLKSLLSN